MFFLSFKSFTHEEKYSEYLEKYLIINNKIKATIYLLTLDDVLQNHMSEIFDLEDMSVNVQSIKYSWQTESSKKTSRLIFMLLENYIPRESTSLDGPELYCITKIFASNLAPYYLEALKICFFPEIC